MDLTALQVWQRSALDPSQGSARPRHTRQRPEESAASRQRDLRRAQEMARRMRETVIQGLFLSVLLGAPVGWLFVRSALLAGDPAVAQACPALSSFLPPELQRNVKELRDAGTLSRSQGQVLAFKVCDPGLRMVVEPVLRGVSDLDELRDLAKREGVSKAGISSPPGSWASPKTSTR